MSSLHVCLAMQLGLDPNETDAGGGSLGMPLWFASMCGWHEIAELLLARGADVNAVVYACCDSMCMAEDEKMKEWPGVAAGASSRAKRIHGCGLLYPVVRQ
jgi:hypothetical protein